MHLPENSPRLLPVLINFVDPPNSHICCSIWLPENPISSEQVLTLAKLKFFVKPKILASITKIFASLHGLAKRALIGFRINKMLETLILQGCIISESIELAMTLRRLRELARFLLFTSCQQERQGNLAKRRRIARSPRKIAAILQNLLDRDFGSHKNWVKIKKLWYFISIFTKQV